LLDCHGYQVAKIESEIFENNVKLEKGWIPFCGFNTNGEIMEITKIKSLLKASYHHSDSWRWIAFEVLNHGNKVTCHIVSRNSGDAPIYRYEINFYKCDVIE
jgi:hypothetical protein